MSGTADPPRLLLVGGAGGLVGRSVLPELLPRFRIRSIHRHPASNEGRAVEWVAADARTVDDWRPLLADVQVVLNLAWYRWGSAATFQALRDGLVRLIEACRGCGVRRFVQVSVPPAPAALESELPYLRCKRQVDAALVRSGISFRIVRPTMLFGPGDVLLGVMLRTMRRYPFFPMFGDGKYHVSPFAAADLGRVLAREAEGSEPGLLDLGGPERLTYQELTDRMYRAIGKRPRYWRLSRAGALRLTRWMVAVGSTTLYPYEVDWLMSDLLGLPAYAGLDRPLVPVGAYLASIASA